MIKNIYHAFFDGKPCDRPGAKMVKIAVIVMLFALGGFILINMSGCAKSVKTGDYCVLKEKR